MVHSYGWCLWLSTGCSADPHASVFLCLASPCDLGFSLQGGWIPKGSIFCVWGIRRPSLRSWNTTLPTFFWTKLQGRLRFDLRAGELDFTSWWERWQRICNDLLSTIWPFLKLCGSLVYAVINYYSLYCCTFCFAN